MKGNFYLRRQDISSGQWKHLREGVSIDDILDSILNDSQRWTEMDYHLGYGNWEDILIISTDSGEIINVDLLLPPTSAFIKDLGTNEISNFLTSNEMIKYLNKLPYKDIDTSSVFRDRLKNLVDSRWSSQIGYEDDRLHPGARVGDHQQIDLLMLKETPRVEIMELKDNSYRLMMNDVYEEFMTDNDRLYFKFSKPKRPEMKVEVDEVEYRNFRGEWGGEYGNPDRAVYGFNFQVPHFFYIDFNNPKEAKRYAEILYSRFLETEDKEFYPVDVDSVIEDSLNRIYVVPDLHWESEEEEERTKTYSTGTIFPCSSALLRDSEGNHYGAVFTPDDDKIFVGFVFLQINGDSPIYPDEDTKQLLDEMNLTKTGRWIVKEKKFLEYFDQTPYLHLQKHFSSRFDALHWVEDTVKEQLEYRGPNSMKAALQKMDLGFEV